MGLGREVLVVSEFFYKEYNFLFGDGGVFFYKLTRNPNLAKKSFFFFFFFFFGGGGGGVCGGGGG